MKDVRHELLVMDRHKREIDPLQTWGVFILWDEGGWPLYVGVSHNVTNSVVLTSSDKPEASHYSFVTYDTESEAMAAAGAMAMQLKPKYNKVPGMPFFSLEQVAYFVAKNTKGDAPADVNAAWVQTQLFEDTSIHLYDYKGTGYIDAEDLSDALNHCITKLERGQ